MGDGVHPTSTAVPARQSAMPAALAGVTGSRIHTAATREAKSGESAFRIAAVDASIAVRARAMSTKGSANPTHPTKRYASQCRLQPTVPPVAATNARSANPAISTRSSISSTGPMYATA